MAHHHCHAISRNCEYTQVKIHTVAELLLLSGTLRPIKTETILEAENSLATAKEQIKSSLNIVLEIVNDVTKAMSEVKTRWKTICDMLYRLSDAVTVLVELCYHLTYQCLTADSVSISAGTTNVSESPMSHPTLVDKYNAAYAGLEIKLSCIQLKRARLEELTASFIMDMCSNISKYISILTDNCRNASEHAEDLSTRDQFKLGVKSVTCATGSLIASIKSYKADKSPRHHTRVVTFCEPVLAASHALVCLATEEEFIHQGTVLSDEQKEIQKSVFGPCMNVVSGCVQICKVLREAAYDTTNPAYIHKANSCHASILKSTNQLKCEMQRHFRIDLQSNSASSPSQADATKFHNSSNGLNSLDSHRDLSPFGRSSPQGGIFGKDDLSPLGRNSPQTGSSFGKEELNPGKDDHSPRSSVATSDMSFSTGSLSR